MASSPAHHNPYRVNRPVGLAIPHITTNANQTASSVSPCLSPIRYALDHSQINAIASQTDEELQGITHDPGQNHFLSVPNDDSSVKVRQAFGYIRNRSMPRSSLSSSLSFVLRMFRVVVFYPIIPRIYLFEVVLLSHRSIHKYLGRFWEHRIIWVRIVVLLVDGALNVRLVVLFQVQKFCCKKKITVNRSSTFSALHLSPFDALISLAAAVDFWALGICLYQFLVGVTPFTDDCPHNVIANILNYRLLWPDHDDQPLSSEAICVIKGLLSYDPTLRYQLEGQPTSCLIASDEFELYFI